MRLMAALAPTLALPRANTRQAARAAKVKQSGFKYVRWSRAQKKWVARMGLGGGRRLYVGVFDDALVAAVALDAAARAEGLGAPNPLTDEQKQRGEAMLAARRIGGGCARVRVRAGLWSLSGRRRTAPHPP